MIGHNRVQESLQPIGVFIYGTSNLHLAEICDDIIGTATSRSVYFCNTNLID